MAKKGSLNDGYHEEVLTRITSVPFIVPDQRKLFKEGFPFSALPFDSQLPIWHHIWKNASGYRARIHAFFFMERFVTKQAHHAAIWETSVSWQEEVDDWPLSDSLSKINTKILESFPDEVYDRLVAWNKHEDPWKRRQSLVSLLYYTRTKKSFLSFQKIIALVDTQLTAPEYYVQKGVGWTLRELFNIYPEKTYAYLEKNIGSVSPIAFTIAMEKMTEQQKNGLKAKRKR